MNDSKTVHPDAQGFSANALADRLAKARETRGFGQQELADKVGTTPQMISAWENAHRTPGAESLYKLSRELRVSAHYLITGEDYAPGEADLMLDQIEAILAVRRAGGSGSPIGRDESLNVLEGEQEARANHAGEDVG